MKWPLHPHLTALCPVTCPGCKHNNESSAKNLTEHFGCHHASYLPNIGYALWGRKEASAIHTRYSGCHCIERRPAYLIDRAHYLPVSKMGC